MDYSKFIASNQKEASISIQRVRLYFILTKYDKMAFHSVNKQISISFLYYQCLINDHINDIICLFGCLCWIKDAHFYQLSKVEVLNLGVNKNLLRHVTWIINCKALLLMVRNAMCINKPFQMFNI